MLNTWSNGPIYPGVARSSGYKGQVGNKMYFLGGAIPNTGYLASCLVLDMETQIWSSLNNISFGTYGGGSSAVHAGNIYCAGGYINNSSEGLFKRYNVAADTWTNLQAPPRVIRDHPTLCSDGDDHIYLFGGWGYEGWTGNKLCYKYQVSNDSWTQIATAPDAIYTAFATTVSPTDIRIFGGISPNHFGDYRPATDYGVNWNWSYNPNTNLWDTTTYTPVPTPGGFSYSARFGDFIYLICRFGANGPSTPPTSAPTVEIYNLVEDSWVTGTPKPTNNFNGVVGVYKGNVFCAGTDASGTGKNVEIFSSFQTGSRVFATIIG